MEEEKKQEPFLPFPFIMCPFRNAGTHYIAIQMAFCFLSMQSGQEILLFLLISYQFVHIDEGGIPILCILPFHFFNFVFPFCG